jgi:nicotinate-nucleotide adenylyltransferase
VIGLLGGVFDPPHNGHVTLARTAVEHFGLERLLVLVVAEPGHKEVGLDAATRLRLAQAAFADVPRAEVRLEPHARTIDSLRAGDYSDAIFLVGADEFADFKEWKEPDALLEHVRLGVATRPGYPRERLDPVLAGLSRPDRVLFFEIDPVDVASRELRRKIADGEPIDADVPPGVADLVRRLGLYRRDVGLH